MAPTKTNDSLEELSKKVESLLKKNEATEALLSEALAKLNQLVTNSTKKSSSATSPSGKKRGRKSSKSEQEKYDAIKIPDVEVLTGMKKDQAFSFRNGKVANTATLKKNSDNEFGTITINGVEVHYAIPLEEKKRESALPKLNKIIKEYCEESEDAEELEDAEDAEAADEDI